MCTYKVIEKPKQFLITASLNTAIIRIMHHVNLTSDIVHLSIHEGKVGDAQAQHAGLGPQVSLLRTVAPVTFSTEAGLAGVPVHLEAPAGKTTETGGKTSDVISLKDMWTRSTVRGNDETSVDGWWSW